MHILLLYVNRHMSVSGLSSYSLVLILDQFALRSISPHFSFAPTPRESNLCRVYFTSCSDTETQRVPPMDGLCEMGDKEKSGYLSSSLLLLHGLVWFQLTVGREGGKNLGSNNTQFSIFRWFRPPSWLISGLSHIHLALSVFHLLCSHPPAFN